MERLPEEILTIIWKKVYSSSVIKQLSWKEKFSKCIINIHYTP